MIPSGTVEKRFPLVCRRGCVDGGTDGRGGDGHGSLPRELTFIQPEPHLDEWPTWLPWRRCSPVFLLCGRAAVES